MLNFAKLLEVIFRSIQHNNTSPLVLGGIYFKFAEARDGDVSNHYVYSINKFIRPR